jgi:hypothetical protein
MSGLIARRREAPASLLPRVFELIAGGGVHVGWLAFAELLVDDEVFDTATQSLFRLAEEVHDLVRAGHEEHGELVLLLDGTAEEHHVFFLGNDEIATFLGFANHVGIGEQGLGLLLEGGEVRLGVLLDGFEAERSATFLEGLADSAESEDGEDDDNQCNKVRPVVGEKNLT